MAIPMLKNGFFGLCSLKIGSLIIAWITVIATGIFSAYIAVAYTIQVINAIQYDVPKYTIVRLKSYIYPAIVMVLVFIANIFNLIGVKKEKAGHMKAWIIIFLIFLSDYTMMFWLWLVQTDFSIIQEIETFLLWLLIMAFCVYSILLEYSYYRTIINRPRGATALV